MCLRLSQSAELACMALLLLCFQNGKNTEGCVAPSVPCSWLSHSVWHHMLAVPSSCVITPALELAEVDALFEPGSNLLKTNGLLRCCGCRSI